MRKVFARRFLERFGREVQLHRVFLRRAVRLDGRRPGGTPGGATYTSAKRCGSRNGSKQPVKSVSSSTRRRVPSSKRTVSSWFSADVTSMSVT
jgi:hypothetical protein